MKKAMARKRLIAAYVFLRKHIFGGRGLSRVKPVRSINFKIEKFLKGRGEAAASVVKHGLRIYLDPRESVAETFAHYEPESTDAIKKYLRPGDTFVDVGASIGWFALHAAKIVGGQGKVYAFEPEPRSFALLERNIDANGFRNIVNAKQAAVSVRRGKTKFYVVGDAWTWGSLEDPRNDYERRIEASFSDEEDRTVLEYEVESLALDDVLPAKVDFVKINVCDFTKAIDWIFQGMRKTIKRNPGLKLLVKNPTKEIVRTLANLGYSCSFLDCGTTGFFAKAGGKPAGGL